MQIRYATEILFLLGVAAGICPAAQSTGIGSPGERELKEPVLLLRPVALTQESLPGLPAGSTVEFFGVHPVLGSTAFGAGMLDDSGQMAFLAAYSDSQGGIPPMGIWLLRDGELHAVALEGQPAPGSTSTYSGFPRLYEPKMPRLLDGKISFSAALASDPGALAIFSDHDGVLTLRAMDGDPAPGAPVGAILQVPEHAPVDPATLLVHGHYSDGFPSDFEEQAFWRDSNGTLSLYLRDDDPAPGTAAGVYFGADTPLATYGTFDTWSTSRLGALTFNGYLKGSAVHELNNEGIWAEVGGGLQLIARENQALDEVAGGLLGASSGYHTFGAGHNLPPVCNDSGTVAFGATFRGDTFDFSEGLFVHRDGQLQLVAAAPGSGTPPSTQAPSLAPGVRFTEFLSARLNAAGALAFAAELNLSCSSVSCDANGIWIDRHGTIDLVASLDQPAAECDANYSNVTLHELLDSGEILFSSYLAGARVSAQNDRGLFWRTPSGEIRLLLRKGDSIEVRGVPRILADFGIGSMTSRKLLSLKLVFADGSSGLFLGRVRTGH
jgi:hypothetical protein